MKADDPVMTAYDLVIKTDNLVKNKYILFRLIFGRYVYIYIETGIRLFDRTIKYIIIKTSKGSW